MGFPVLFTYTITHNNCPYRTVGWPMEGLVMVTVRKQHFLRSEAILQNSVYSLTQQLMYDAFSPINRIHRSRNQRVEMRMTLLITSLSETCNSWFIGSWNFCLAVWSSSWHWANRQRRGVYYVAGVSDPNYQGESGSLLHSVVGKSMPGILAISCMTLALPRPVARVQGRVQQLNKGRTFESSDSTQSLWRQPPGSFRNTMHNLLLQGLLSTAGPTGGGLNLLSIWVLGNPLDAFIHIMSTDSVWPKNTVAIHT